MNSGAVYAYEFCIYLSLGLSVYDRRIHPYDLRTAKFLRRHDDPIDRGVVVAVVVVVVGVFIALFVSSMRRPSGEPLTRIPLCRACVCLFTGRRTRSNTSLRTILATLPHDIQNDTFVFQKNNTYLTWSRFHGGKNMINKKPGWITSRTVSCKHVHLLCKQIVVP